MNPLASTLRSGGLKFSQAYLQENSGAAAAAAARKTVEESDIVIVGMYGRVRSGARNSVGIPENGAAIVREALAAGKTVIGISFGNPYILGSFPEMKTYIVSYGDMSSLQRATARVLLGQQQATGKLPISLPGLHPRGTGIGVSMLRPISPAMPVYPEVAIAVRAIGDVLVEIEVGENGVVTNAMALSGHPLLRQASINAARSTKFDSVSGIDRRSQVTYRFSLGQDSKEPCCGSFPYIINVVGKIPTLYQSVDRKTSGN